MAEFNRFPLSVANLCQNPRDAVFGGVEGHRDFLHEAGVYPGGYQITPTRPLAHQILQQAKAGKFQNIVDGQPFMTSGHQGWGGWRGVLRGAVTLKPKEALQNYVVTSQSGSLPTLERFEDIVGDDFSAVVYGQYHRHGEPYRFGFGQSVTQIMPELLAAYGLEGLYSQDASQRTPGLVRLVSAFREQNIEGVVVDEAHLLRKSYDGSTRLYWQRVLEDVEAAGIKVKQLHVPGGRTDVGDAEDKKRSGEEFHALMTGPEELGRTALGEVLAWSAGIWRRQNPTPEDVEKLRPEAEDRQTSTSRLLVISGIVGQTNRVPNPVLPVVFEGTWNALAKYRATHRAAINQEQRPVSRADIIGMHQQVAHTIGSYLEQQTA